MKLRTRARRRGGTKYEGIRTIKAMGDNVGVTVRITVYESAPVMAPPLVPRNRVSFDAPFDDLPNVDIYADEGMTLGLSWISRQNISESRLTRPCIPNFYPPA